jgi:hypothetical protein
MRPEIALLTTADGGVQVKDNVVLKRVRARRQVPQGHACSPHIHLNTCGVLVFWRGIVEKEGVAQFGER